MPAAEEADAVSTSAAGGTAHRDEGQRILLHGVTWDRYVELRDLLDDMPGLRMTYLRGALEISKPSKRHEVTKVVLARLIELYALERDIDLAAFGSTTYRKAAEASGLEPDECYCIGDDDKPVPDFALEVVLTSGLVDKLEVYRGLGVPEVWIWSRGRLTIHSLGPSGYAPRPRSAFLPDLDLDLVAECVEIKGQSAAVRAFRERLRQPT